MTGSAIGDEEFTRLAMPFRRELLAHCYRMLGSAQEAEDLVQETFIRAWRSYDRFEGRSSLRVWLYRIATNACLRAIEQGARRVLPSELGAASSDPHGPLDRASSEVAWLQPLARSVFSAESADPAEIVLARGSVRLAFVAALQHLSARQRAVLVLREVLKFRATEVADILDTTTAAVNSALQRARAQLALASPAAEELADPTDPGLKALLDRYVTAFHDADLDALEQVLRDDVALEMPPLTAWFAGRPAVLAFLRSRVLDVPGRVRMVPASANGQSAFATYFREEDGPYRAHAVHVLDATPNGISRIHVFMDPDLFKDFGMALSLRDEFPSRLGSLFLNRLRGHETGTA